MSAYMVDEEHINVMIWAAAELASPSDTGPVFTYCPAPGAHPVRVASTERDSMTRAGQMLADANAASMAALYGNEDHSYAYIYTRPKRTDWKQTDILSALLCFEYQACEVGNFDTTEAGRFCDALRKGLIRRLPGMNDAPWEIGPHAAPAHAAV